VADASILVRALGPLEVGGPGTGAALGGPRQRGVLALLVARAGQAASMDELIDGVWGEEPPASARKTVQGYLAVLRRAVGPLGVKIDSARSGAYALAIERSSIDIVCFEDLASSAAPLRSTEPARAHALLTGALSLWRGRAFGDLANLPGIEPYAVRLEELRCSAYEQLLELEIALGHLDRAAAGLEVFTREEPWREQPWLLLMTAQFRQGRQAEALRAYERMRLLWAEAGLDPTPSLRDASSRILTDQEPRLERVRVVAAPDRASANLTDADLPHPWPLPPTCRRLTESPDRFVGRQIERSAWCRGRERAPDRLRQRRAWCRQDATVRGARAVGRRT
jgi:DNA-binding SARP family transcriptional activator